MSKPVSIFWALLGSVVLSSAASAIELELSPDSDVVGEIQVIEAQYEDTFIKLARRYNLGWEELIAANPGVDPWLPGEGTEIVLPTHFVP